MATTTIIFQTDYCAIIQYPERLKVTLVDHVHGQNKVGQSGTVIDSIVTATVKLVLPPSF